MRIRKVVRRKGRSGVSAVNAVIATNVGESDEETTASSHQHVKITQRDGQTEVRELHTDTDG
ncbi:MAG TPA: hypothetical protein VNA57_08110 [Acidimicrobiales bacterium]|nr:hypothetical protein [Acidimicrobiales bacterium]